MIRNFVFTSFDEEIPQVGVDGTSYVIVGYEICPTTGKSHLQGYCELDSPVRFSTLKRRFPTMHIEKRMGSAAQAIKYCKKDGKWTEYGEPKKQGKRSDLIDLADAIVANVPMDEIALSDPACFIRNHRGLSAFRYTIQADRVTKPYIEWRWGPTGSGKTHVPYETHKPSVYIKDGTAWWDGYSGQDAIIIDDFDKDDWKFRDLLRLLDRYPYQGQVKGAVVKITSAFIYITCDKSPSDIWGGSALAQIMRRLDKVEHVTRVTEVSGNTNPTLQRQNAFIQSLPFDDMLVDQPRRFLTSAHDNL